MSWAVVLAALTATLAVDRPADARVRFLRPSRGRPARSRLRDASVWTSPMFAAVLAGFTVTRVVSGVPGLLAAVGVAVVVHRWVSGLESSAARRRRQQISRDLPLAVDLMVAALAAGRPHDRVLSLVGRAVGGPLAEDLAAVVSQLDLGTDPLVVWRGVARQGALEPLGRSFARATESGVPASTVLERCADDLRAKRRASAQRAARSVGVRTAAPLGACFLPAFVLVGIVPTLIGAFDHLLV